MIIEQKHQDITQLILTPDRSLDWRGNKLFFASVSLVTLAIAGWFAWLGAWLILPFAGLEMAALALALYWVAHKGLDKEVVTISADAVEISRGKQQPEQVTHLQRCWMQVRLVGSNHNWYPSRLLLRSHGKETEIGGFLGETERVDLARKLKQIVS